MLGGISSAPLVENLKQNGRFTAVTDQELFSRYPAHIWPAEDLDAVIRSPIKIVAVVRFVLGVVLQTELPLAKRCDAVTLIALLSNPAAHAMKQALREIIADPHRFSFDELIILDSPDATHLNE